MAPFPPPSSPPANYDDGDDDGEDLFEFTLIYESDDSEDPDDDGMESLVEIAPLHEHDDKEDSDDGFVLLDSPSDEFDSGDETLVFTPVSDGSGLETDISEDGSSIVTSPSTSSTDTRVVDEDWDSQTDSGDEPDLEIDSDSDSESDIDISEYEGWTAEDIGMEFYRILQEMQEELEEMVLNARAKG